MLSIAMQVCEVLAEKALDGNEEVKWAVASRLRDHLLLPSERKSTALWKEVNQIWGDISLLCSYLQNLSFTFWER